MMAALSVIVMVAKIINMMAAVIIIGSRSPAWDGGGDSTYDGGGHHSYDGGGNYDFERCKFLFGVVLEAWEAGNTQNHWKLMSFHACKA